MVRGRTDTTIHVAKDFFPVRALQVFAQTMTGCRRRRPPTMLTEQPSEVTCPECRQYSKDYWKNIADTAAMLIEHMLDENSGKSHPVELATLERKLKKAEEMSIAFL